MRIICSPDSFKESLSAPAAAAAMARGIRSVLPDARIDECPIADGGEGTVDAMLAATDGRRKTTTVSDPMGNAVEAQWGLVGHGGPGPLTAVIEMAAASGLALVRSSDRDPARTTTFGTGQLIKAALDAGARRIILGIGGSATNDGGCGTAQALGVRFFDPDGTLIPKPITGGLLDRLARFDLQHVDPRLKEADLVIACDVNNPLTGPDGAAHVYGPQKGASPEQVRALDRGLAHLAAIWRARSSEDFSQQPGAGAAGGLGFGTMAFLGGRLRRGVELVLEAMGFQRRLQGCDLCLTGEGKLDSQTLSGKAIAGVAAAAAAAGVPAVALVGCVGPGAERVQESGLRSYRVIGPGLSSAESISRAAELLESAAADQVLAELNERL